MTAQILVVDDVPANVKLLEARLTTEYYGVISAKDGYEALELAREKKPDLILLDVMMPGIDGFETCRQMKEDAEIAHIPVVMVTALSEQADRVRGLEVGADDFLTKPINDIALLARVRSLVRIKVLLDELRLRDKTRVQMGIGTDNLLAMDISSSKVLLIEDDPVQLKHIVNKTEGSFQLDTMTTTDGAVQKARGGQYDAIIISAMLLEEDGIRLAAQMKGKEELRHVPIIMLVDEDDQPVMVKVLEMGFNDYLPVPVEKNEMVARVRTQIRRKKYQDALRANYHESISMAITDSLTGLYNRHYLDTHLANMVAQALQGSRPLSLMIMDMDHFKEVNDTHGHDAGDAVLRQMAQLIISNARSTDLVARFGGEEFVVLLPDTGFPATQDAAERLRKHVESYEFVLPSGEKIKKTLSIGLAILNLSGRPMPDSGESLLKRADEALYEAKNSGRNKVCASSSNFDGSHD